MEDFGHFGDPDLTETPEIDDVQDFEDDLYDAREDTIFDTYGDEDAGFEEGLFGDA